VALLEAMKYKVTGRVWIETKKGTQVGAGRIALLKKVKQLGSITEAARAMKMSYRQAWEQIDAMNKLADKPLIIRTSGGSGGGGSVVTKEGEKLIGLFHKLESNFNKFTKKMSSKI
jgi:molybdate transport system regulatory protein